MHLILLAYNHIFLNTSTCTLELQISVASMHNNERFKSHLLGCQGLVAVLFVKHSGTLVCSG